MSVYDETLTCLTTLELSHIRDNIDQLLPDINGKEVSYTPSTTRLRNARLINF